MNCGKNNIIADTIIAITPEILITIKYVFDGSFFAFQLSTFPKKNLGLIALIKPLMNIRPIIILGKIDITLNIINFLSSHFRLGDR